MIRTEEIYDAATDDAAFEHLACRLADAVGARSGVLHWGDSTSTVAEISYSGYFSGEQMALYDEEFLYDDIWGEALDGKASNRVWNCEAFVPDAAYEGSRIYNEWIRPMGDDTFRCLGGIIRHGDTIGHIGLHRGRTQRAFAQGEVESVQNIVDHLGRMFDIRRRLGRAEHHGRSLHATLDMVDHAVFTLSASGALLNGNRAADAMLRRQDALVMRQRHIVARNPQDDLALQAALRAAAAREATHATALLVQREQGQPYMLSVAALSVGDTRQIVVIVTDPQAHDASLANRIRALYGLTRAEAEVVSGLCEGKALEQLAQERGVALNTVRTQMKAIYLKMDCSRQSELVARVARLPRFGGAQA
ncbi:helix-turn-helix transcriptional regulator [Sphingobium sp. CAP-1]|uniref:helix-turn-helix transcriptional regulator n=1 Tax=Sphingobium sp. CAP-1 TaxID=2676077 RepID=UPI0012BB47CA|nr:helix-turn-helix transcriptional regulator [Sphingobium sp. CAP-1]QGP77691.1 LuxR family transcriptional regulator [Sphingobium sp. CAP-1]